MTELTQNPAQTDLYQNLLNETATIYIETGKTINETKIHFQHEIGALVHQHLAI